MTELLECWVRSAKALFSQALSGEPELEEGFKDDPLTPSTEFLARFEGDAEGIISIFLPPDIFQASLLGEGTDQAEGWNELLREVAEAAVGDLLVRNGKKCRLRSLTALADQTPSGQPLRLRAVQGSWALWLLDTTQSRAATVESSAGQVRSAADSVQTSGSGEDRLMDIELEASLRFGCREMQLGEILNLGPGDVVDLDRHATDLVDLVVGDKIVARGDVVLVNGNFALRIAAVESPRLRLESTRCLF